MYIRSYKVLHKQDSDQLMQVQRKKNKSSFQAQPAKKQVKKYSRTNCL